MYRLSSYYSEGWPRLNSMVSSPWMLLWGVSFIPAALDIRQIKEVKRRKQSCGMISPQAESFAVNTPHSVAFTNNMTSLVRQTISYDTVSAAFPVMNMISIVLECVSVRVRVRESDAASDLICLFASVCRNSPWDACVSGCVHAAQCLMVCDHEAVGDKQAGKRHVLSPGFIYIKQSEYCAAVQIPNTKQDQCAWTHADLHYKLQLGQSIIC